MNRNESHPKIANERLKNVTVSIFLIALTFYSIHWSGFLYNEYSGSYAELMSHPAMSESTWIACRARSLEDRVSTAPETLIEYINLLYGENGHRENVRSPVDDVGLINETRSALIGLPEQIRGHMAKHLVGVFFVDNLSTAGLAHILKARWGHKFGLIVLNKELLQTSLGSFLSTRESSAFGKGGLSVSIHFDEGSSDNRAALIRYLILHEYGHIYSVVEGIEPHYFSVLNPASGEFAKISWDQASRSKYDSSFEDRKSLRFYQGRTILTNERIEPAFNGLMDSDFISFYSARSSREDFAETFAIYVYSVVMKNRFSLQILDNGRLLKEVKCPINHPRFLRKRRFFDAEWSKL